ncbi:MAG: hypothetical protein ACREKA_08475, partial [Candidatus Methylomirabilales bacterium]
MLPAHPKNKGNLARASGFEVAAHGLELLAGQLALGVAFLQDLEGAPAGRRPAAGARSPEGPADQPDEPQD